MLRADAMLPLFLHLYLLLFELDKFHRLSLPRVFLCVRVLKAMFFLTMKMSLKVEIIYHARLHIGFPHTPAQVQYSIPQEFCIWIRIVMKIFSDRPRPIVTAAHGTA
jgi:hypothetical protein